MIEETVIAVDCMSGDKGVVTALSACANFLAKHSQAKLILLGDGAEIKQFRHPRCEIILTTEVVRMEDSLEVALRRKKDSSMRKAIEQVKLGKAQVALSAGNTGALMALSRYLLKTIPGIDRPAIAFALPNDKGQATTMLDLGANVDCSAEHLLQFALLGSALDVATKNISQPTVGLLNIGAEAIKGNEVVKQAANLLEQADQQKLINFYGNVEGGDIFKATVDVVVCDGFVGNVALKTIEGFAGMISTSLKQEFNKSWLSKLSAIVAWPVLQRFKKRFDHRSYNGAALLGLRGLVFKSHGSADIFSFECALQRAYTAAQQQLLSKIVESVEKNNLLTNN